MSQENNHFYIKVFLLVILIVSLVYVLGNKPEKTVVVTRQTSSGEEEQSVIRVEESPSEPVQIEVVVPTEQVSNITKVEETPTLTPPTAAIPPQSAPTIVPGSPQNNLTIKYNIPEALQNGLTDIKEIDNDIILVTRQISDGKNSYYTYIPSSGETTQIEDGTFKLVHNEKTYYFVNGIYYEYQAFKIFKIEDEINRLLGRNLNYRESNELDKIIYICQVTDTSFIALIGSENSYDKAQLYFFDEEVDKVRFYSIDAEDAEQLGSGTECVS